LALPSRGLSMWERSRLRDRLASQLIESEPLAHDLRNRPTEPLSIIHILAVIVSEGLLIKVTER
jgi:hypothetical protein